MQARKDAIVTKMTKGIEFLFKKNKITWLQGFGASRRGRPVHDRGRRTARHRDDPGEARDRRDRLARRHLPDITVDNELVCDNEGRSPSPRCPSAWA
jgi:dihydrolipoamide dehydrogenase